MTNEEAIKLIDDRMCWGRGKRSKHHMPEIDEYWQAGLMAIEALKAQIATDTNVGSKGGDTIYRQAAIDLVEGLESARLKGKIDLLYPKMVKGLIGLPSAQPEEDCDTCKHGYFGNDQCNNCRVRYPSHYERRTDD